MDLRPTVAAMAATLLCLQATAQNSCPRERAEVVPRQIVTGNTRDCGGIEVNIGGVRVHDASGGCPLFIIYEPEHHVARPTDRDTMVEIVQLLDVTHMTFECERKWFLFIPYDTACSMTGTRVAATVPMLRTIPCPAEPTAPGPQS